MRRIHALQIRPQQGVNSMLFGRVEVSSDPCLDLGPSRFLTQARLHAYRIPLRARLSQT